VQSQKGYATNLSADKGRISDMKEPGK
jgi:hypothetical protein